MTLASKLSIPLALLDVNKLWQWLSTMQNYHSMTLAANTKVILSSKEK